MLTLALSLFLACAPKAGRDRPKGPQEETFDFAWRFVKDAVPEGQLDEPRWQEVHDDLLPRARVAETPAELRPVLSEMLASLGQSHYSVVSGTVNAVLDEVLRDSPFPVGFGDPGLDVRLLDHEIVVTRLFTGGAAEAAGLVLGDQLVAIEGRPIAAWTARLEAGVEDPWLARAYARVVVVQALMAPEHQTIRVTVERHGAVADHALSPGPSTLVEGFGLGGREPLHFERRLLDEHVGYVFFDHFMVPIMDPFRAAIVEWKASGVEALVIDLRGNPGGLVSLVRGLSGHLIADRKTSLGSMITLAGTMDLTVNPHPPTELVSGPVAILVDDLSASTSEVFAAGLQAIGRARVFGATTAGRALPSTFIELPNGDLLQVVTGRFVDPSGRAIEGEGIAPDVAIPLDRAGLVGGRDPAIEAARSWIESEAEPK